jgi:hypothetical protein
MRTGSMRERRADLTRSWSFEGGVDWVRRGERGGREGDGRVRRGVGSVQREREGLVYAFVMYG